MNGETIEGEVSANVADVADTSDISVEDIKFAYCTECIIEKRNAKYKSHQRIRAINATGKNVRDIGTQTDEAIKQERDARIDKMAEEKVAESGGTMSMEAARAASRKELAKSIIESRPEDLFVIME